MSVGRGVFWKKTTVEESCQLDISRLSKEYDLEWESETIQSWTSSRGRHDSIGLDIIPPQRIRLHYATTKRSTGEETKLDYQVQLVTTRCNYGGKRWWYLCPNCNRRCRILYLPPGGDYFLCRLCHNLTYESQQEGKTKWSPFFDAFTKIPELERRLCRMRSPKKIQKIERKLERLYLGMHSPVNRDRRRNRRKKN